MNEYKRKLRSYTKEMNKLRKTISTTSIENLSNEVLYDIFDYLDGYDIYAAFSNLNHRFEQLLNSSILLFKIKLRSPSNKLYKNFYKQMKHLNKHQIFSLNLHLPLKTNHFFSSFYIDSSFYDLESLTLNQLDPDLLMSVLFKLTSLPRLFSLTIDMLNVLKDLTDIYRIVFTFPTLKYYNFSIGDSNFTISLPIATDHQFSSIVYLIIDHCCSFEQLSIITSYTPQLHHLSFMHTCNSDRNLEVILPITLSNLTYLSVKIYEIKFDKFEIFISKIDSKLKVLSLTTLSEDVVYLDDDRWEELILKYMPQLEKFYFQYYEHIDYENQFPICLQEPNQFNSSFWIQRQWMYEVKIELEDIIYSIYPYKKRWYENDTQLNVENSSTSLSKSARLILLDIPPDTCQDLLILDICRALSINLIYHLEIPETNISIGTLIQVIDTIPELNSLQIHSLLLDQPKDLSEEEFEIFLLSDNRHELTKVYLNKMIDIKEIYFLINFFPSMAYLKVGSINNMDVKLFVENILKKILSEDNSNLHSLCFSIPTADDQMIKNLKKMINYKKLLIDYTIKCVFNNIYLQWK